ncbi:MAG: serine protease, partial [Planctomycetota bacterium]|nr:serine protease [Planctomycetota bacterium]
HVVAGYVTVKDGVEKRDPVTVAVYRRDLKDMDEYLTDIVAYNKQHDLVLLKMREGGKCFQTARLATRKDLSEVTVFTPVYAVGCPLGHSPLPSTGEITCQNKEVDGEQYWMMNAPTIYGNSGGGIFIVEGRRFTGVSAMLCVYQQFINVPVTHLGVMVPAATVYDWLDTENFQFVYDSRYTMDGCLIARWKALLRSLMIRRSVPAMYDVPVRLVLGE